MKYFIYCRKSTEAEDRQVLSIDSQEAELRRALENKDEIEIVDIYRESFSAKAPGRPLFEEMLRRIEKREAEGIIAWHPDRLARNSVDGGRIIYLLDRKALKDLRFTTFTFENNPQGKFMLSIIFGYSKYYVDSLGENVRRGNRAKLERGWRPNHAPIGYLNDRDTKTIVKDPARFPLVRKMWDLMLSGTSSPRKIYRIARHEWALTTVQRKRIGGQLINLSHVYKILTNPFYAGVVEWAGRTYPGSHEPMITLDEFEHVQQLLGRPARPRPKRRVFAYTGMIRCGECGLSVTAEHKVNRHGYHYTYYHCTKRRPNSVCRQRSIEVRELEAQLLAFLKAVSIPDALHSLTLQQLERMHAEAPHGEKAQRASVERAHDEAVTSLENLTKLRIRDLIDDAEYLRQRQGLERERLRLLEQIDRLEHAAAWFEPAKMFISFSNRAISWFQVGDDEVKRAIVEIVCSNLRLRNQKLLIEAAKPFRIWTAFPSRPKLLAAVEDVRTLKDEAAFQAMLGKMRRLFIP